MRVLVVDADLRSIRAIAPWLVDNVENDFSAEVAAALIPRMELGLQELAVNIVEHGYAGRPGTIELHFAAGDRTAIIEVVDDAPAVELRSVTDDRAATDDRTADDGTATDDRASTDDGTATDDRTAASDAATDVTKGSETAPDDVDGTRVRGYGLSLIDQLTTEFVVRHDGRTNRWRVVFPLVSPLQRTP